MLKLKEVRPTSGRVLSALFNILGEFAPNIKFLDMFAGTGRVGFEAVKRGAEVFFIESVKPRADEIKKLSDSKKINCTVLNLEVRRAVKYLIKREIKFNYIFADPPYNSGWGEELTSLRDLNKIFADKCIFIFEHSTREEIRTGELEIFLNRDYGESSLTFLRMREIITGGK